MADHDTIQHLTYDDLGRVVANNRNGYPDKILFPGGYYFYESADDLMIQDYYVQDYQGNNRMVVKGSQTIDQVNHYYPDGSLMGEISIEGHAQKFRFGGKELDKTYGLNLYDFHARQYDPQVPAFTSIDPKAEVYYGISPYAYCAGDPVNCVDPDGKKVVLAGGKPLKDNYNYATSYLRSIGAGGIIDQMEQNPNYTITVTMTLVGESRYNKGKLVWNPYQGVIIHRLGYDY